MHGQCPCTASDWGWGCLCAGRRGVHDGAVGDMLAHRSKLPSVQADVMIKVSAWCAVMRRVREAMFVLLALVP